MRTRGVYFAYMGKRNSLTDCVESFFLVTGIHDIITCIKFGDDRLGDRLRVGGGQSSPFPINFAGRPYNYATACTSC